MKRIAVIQLIDGRLWIDFRWKTSDTGYLPPPYSCIQVNEIVMTDEAKEKVCKSA